jgi:uncharacterized protein
MPDLETYKTIKKDVSTKDDLDFSFLRQTGLEYIEQLGSKLWTDYNTHDPGITILDMLCYAITDLGNRMNMPFEIILSPENKDAAKIEEQFFLASDILPTKAVCETDYRKIFIDVDGVKNCWISAYSKRVFVDCLNNKLAYTPEEIETTDSSYITDFKFKGLYQLLIQFEELDPTIFSTPELINEQHELIKDAIRVKYHQNRNLCEDLVKIEEVGTHPVSVCASIDILKDADEELVLARILRAIDNYFSPTVKFRSLKQMQERGYTSDEIFEGPLLINGFIDPKELKASELRTEVRLSDLIQIIMKIEGVNIIKDISIGDCNDPDDKGKKWNICIDAGKMPVRCNRSAFSFYKGVLPVNINQRKVELYIDQLRAAEKEEQETARLDMELTIPEGVYLNTGEYTTIQNDFPDTYGIGESGLPARVPIARKSQAKQLKAYLLFFDQVLASYFAHLGKVKDLLSFKNTLRKTYFTQAVSGIKGFDELVNNYSLDNNQLTNELFGGLDQQIERKNKLLDHLIARFAEMFSEYAFLMKELYGSHASQVVLQSKEDFLLDYNTTSKERGSAFNYYKQPFNKLWNTDNVAGVQKRIARLTGIKDYTMRDLTATFIQIYSLIVDGKLIYRWKIRNKIGEEILLGTEDFKTETQARTKLYMSILSVLETTAENIEKAFSQSVIDKMLIGNFLVHISDTGEYSFDVIISDLSKPTDNNSVIASQNKFYSSASQLKEALLTLRTFFAIDFSEEGMFLVEHILLRPDVTINSNPLSPYLFLPLCEDSCNGCQSIDPYSFRVTIVLPGWTYRFGNPDFRKFMEDLIREELPAHILPRICWVGNAKNVVPDNENDMLQFQEAYHQFLLSKTNNEQQQNIEKLTGLISIMSKLNTIYSHGRLIDCKDEDESLEGKIILGRTNLGTN